MALIQINADLRRVTETLEKIANLLELAIRPPPEEPGAPSDLEDLYSYELKKKTLEGEWQSYGPRSNYK